MSASRSMGPTRRRAIPGMPSQVSARDEELLAEDPRASEELESTVASDPIPRSPQSTRAAPSERRAADYGATQLANFRLPVDLHRRFQALVHELEERHPRLRKQSLTELVIALLEEGPQSADEVAALIRRKRLAEHEER